MGSLEVKKLKRCPEKGSICCTVASEERQEVTLRDTPFNICNICFTKPNLIYDAAEQI